MAHPGPTLGFQLGNDGLKTIETIRKGVPVEMVDALIEQGVVSRKQVYDLVAPRRTLTHRRSRGEPLTTEESERLFRVNRIVQHAIETFGNADKARAYLNKPMRRFEGRSCVDMLDTNLGAELVQELLTRIDHGIPG
ncbi:type II RES/Xre toxin-antitoxin system antitoxin [Spiribacter halobius]|uniref:Uncharacterized protein n=1 Tax=Sediminicurvatus halobius TaxID=2182432 RepID=A0A2U2MYR1_9GAMM|nr:antitoxin Xre-like helix-turn-helix domain-containing protein [Spiribacter halobius]PWG61854.1 hypothetical protein DEM34_14705 [Spiribacter halobius]UEX77697.1 DUF2384 domain-containing protein [Spiribacter halobius]